MLVLLRDRLEAVLLRGGEAMLSEGRACVQMDREKLMRMANSVRTGGKGTVRR